MIEYLQILGQEVYKIIFILIPILVSVAMIVWLDRRVWGLVQKRRGPNVVGPFGLFQTLADALKYIFKEIIIPASANKIVFILAPIVTMTLALVAWAVIPLSEDLVLSNINVGVLYLFAISSLGVYGIIMGGWASNSKYPFLGAIRSKTNGFLRSFNWNYYNKCSFMCRIIESKRYCNCAKRIMVCHTSFSNVCNIFYICASRN